MRPHDFWYLANRLVANEKNPEGFRTAISRAYCAAFLSAEVFIGAMGIPLLGGPGRHTELLTILGNSGDAALTSARNTLSELRRQRNAADNDLTDKRVENDANVRLWLSDAFDVIAELNRCRLDAPRFTAVTTATRACVKQLRGIP